MQPLVRQLEHLCLEKDKDGNTPLHLAASLGNLQAMESGLLNSEIWDEGATSDVEEEEGGSEGGSEEEQEEEEGGSGGGSEEEKEEEEEGGEEEGGSGGEGGGSGGGGEEKEADEETGDGGSGKREPPTKGVEKAGEEEEDAEEASTDEWVVVSFKHLLALQSHWVSPFLITLQKGQALPFVLSSTYIHIELCSNCSGILFLRVCRLLS